MADESVGLWFHPTNACGCTMEGTKVDWFTFDVLSSVIFKMGYLSRYDITNDPIDHQQMERLFSVKMTIAYFRLNKQNGKLFIVLVYRIPKKADIL